MTVDRTKFNEIQEIPKGGLLNIQRANGGVLAFDDVEYTPGGGGGGIIVIPATWSPADVTQDETTALFTLPANVVIIAATTEVAIPTDAGSTPGLIVKDANGEFYSSSFPLAADSSEAMIGVDDTWIGKTPVTFFVPTVFSAYYTAGVTPGATTPVVEIYFWALIVP